MRYICCTRGAEPRSLWEMVPQGLVLCFEKIIVSRVVEDDSKERENECGGGAACRCDVCH